MIEYDEKDCWQIELDQCNPMMNIQCLNGQCIPSELCMLMILDSPDCLDQSDEMITESIMIRLNYQQIYMGEPIFRSEDAICTQNTRSSTSFKPICDT